MVSTCCESSLILQLKNIKANAEYVQEKKGSPVGR